MQTLSTLEEAKTWLQTIGAAGKIRAGIQIDVNVAFRSVGESRQEASICDHNCTREGGNYECPASFTLPGNHGLKRDTMAPVEVLAEWIITSAIGLGKAVDNFLEVHFDHFCARSNITNPIVKDALWSMLVKGGTEINLFGGNPEMHPQIARLVGILKDRSFTVNLTTTGRRWLTEPKFGSQLDGIEPNVLALSLDDLEIGQLRRLSTMTTAQIKGEWNQIPKRHGQKQKAHEAVAVLRYYEERGGYPNTVLFNMVLHSGNLAVVDKMFEAVADVAPTARLNPYADQTAFANQPGSFGEREMALFERFEDRMIEQSKDPTANIGKRLQHHLLHKANIIVNRQNPRRTSDGIGGDSIWRCYNELGAGFYVQIGRSPDTFVPISAVQAKKQNGHRQVHPGGHLGCYWNPDTVTQVGQVADANQVYDYVTYGMRVLAKSASTPCRGCRMPRLDSVHLVVLEQGIVDPEVRNVYQQLRLEHAGF